MGAIENYAESCYENLPSETGDKTPWQEISEGRKEHFRELARSLGRVFPETYPGIAAELQAEKPKMYLVSRSSMGDSYLKLYVDEHPVSVFDYDPRDGEEKLNEILAGCQRVADRNGIEFEGLVHR
ncbi:hypothetical protein FK530_23005 [Tsukamurella conjunctivitidis]|uniref:Uncharacterized protein n=1 Tax=Tsukamurella conjunctivitidis TaxID=2592068 RepID=A0A5C5RTP2_9ACTN|nr:hypothetical protein [Tsukamurella conjunctivitidis]TWS25591.1 hypothetical protein FK530_23005 [Tsukamurella conjunctivitidis]